MTMRRCPHCNSRNVHPSRQKSLFEVMVLLPFLLRPYRCHTCSRRHYGSAFRKRRVPGVRTRALSLRPPRLIFQEAFLLLVLLGAPFLFASSGPVLKSIDSLVFARPRSTSQAFERRSRIPPPPMSRVMASRQAAVRPVGLLAPGRGTSPWGQFALATSAPQRQPLGALRTAGKVYLNESQVPTQAMVFVGDALRTGPGGTAELVVPGKGTLLICQQTQLSFEVPGGYFAALKQGAASFRSFAGVQNFEIHLGSFVVTPDPEAEAGADIERAADGSAHITATLGSVGVIAVEGPQSTFIHAGQEVFVSPDGRLLSAAPTEKAPSKPPQQPPSGATQKAPSGPGPKAPGGAVERGPSAPEKGVAKGKPSSHLLALGAVGAGLGGVAAILASQSGGSGPPPASPSTP